MFREACKGDIKTTNSTNSTNKLVLPDESFQIMGACFEVYNHLGCGFLEAVYHDALAIELTERHIPFHDRMSLAVHYKTYTLATHYKPDFICFDKVIVEIKAATSLRDEHRPKCITTSKVPAFGWGCWSIAGSIQKSPTSESSVEIIRAICVIRG